MILASVEGLARKLTPSVVWNTSAAKAECDRPINRQQNKTKNNIIRKQRFTESFPFLQQVVT
jgi:hypothetical protein